MTSRICQGLTRWTSLHKSCICYTCIHCGNQERVICSQASQKVTLSPSPSFPHPLSLYSFRYFWRRHPQLREVDLNFISLFWPFLPSGLQAAYEDFDKDLVFLFKGNVLLLVFLKGKAGLLFAPHFQKVQARKTPVRSPGLVTNGHKWLSEFAQAGPSLGLSTVLNKHNSRDHFQYFSALMLDVIF